MKTKSMKINEEYKQHKRIEKERLKREKMIEKRRLLLKQKRTEAIEKAKVHISSKYEKQLLKYKKQQETMLEKHKRKIEGKKKLKKHIKTKTTAKLKQELYRLVQLHSRLRDSDVMWYGRCISCWKVVHYKKADWWHYIGRRNMITAFDPNNINLQCKFCNWQLKWNITQYRIWLVAKIWLDKVKKLENSEWKIKKWNRWDIEDMIKYYKKENKILEDNKQQPLI